MSYIIVIIQAFYHNNPFLSVSYLHCFLFVCFYFRPLNKKSKVRCLKLFLLFFSLKQGCWYAFYSPPGWEREHERNRGVGTDFFSDITLESSFGVYGLLWYILPLLKHTASTATLQLSPRRTLFPNMLPWFQSLSICTFPSLLHLKSSYLALSLGLSPCLLLYFLFFVYCCPPLLHVGRQRRPLYIVTENRLLTLLSLCQVE